MSRVKALLTCTLAASVLLAGAAWSWEVASYEPAAILQTMPSPEEAVALRQTSNIPLRRLREAHRHAADKGWLGLPAVRASAAVEAAASQPSIGHPPMPAPRASR